MTAALRVIPVAPRTRILLLLGSAIGVLAFTWPLVMSPTVAPDSAATAPWIFAALVPLLLAVVASELNAGGIDARAIAVLGVLSALAIALRPLGGGITGFQPMFAVLIIGGYAYGAGFGFVLGATAMAGSALLTGGAGPWVPFQMLAAAWVAMGAGLLPHPSAPADGGRHHQSTASSLPTMTRHRAPWRLIAYAAIAGLLFGLIMDLAFWPWALSGAAAQSSAVGFAPGAGFVANLQRFITFHLATAMGWDLTRAITTAIIVALAGPIVLRALTRAGRRARFAPANQVVTVSSGE